MSDKQALHDIVWQRSVERQAKGRLKVSGKNCWQLHASAAAYPDT